MSKDTRTMIISTLESPSQSDGPYDIIVSAQEEVDEVPDGLTQAAVKIRGFEIGPRFSLGTRLRVTVEVLDE